MMQIRDKFNTNEGLCFIQQYFINQGLKKFGEAGKAGVDKELKQMLMTNCFTPDADGEMNSFQKHQVRYFPFMIHPIH